MSTIYDTFVSIFGEYAPIVTTDGTTTITDTNWGYIGSVVIFAILFYCSLRILGAVICKDR